MKKSFFALFCLLLLVQCSSEEPETYTQRVKIVLCSNEYFNATTNGLMNSEAEMLDGVGGASVKFFLSESDMLGGINVVQEFVTDNEGFFEFQQKFTETFKYFIKAEYQEYNNLRTYVNRFEDVFGSGEDNFKLLPLALTPSKLQIQVLNSSGQPIPNAFVQVYPSEEDYNASTFSYLWLDDYPEFGGSTFNQFNDYEGYTNANGSITIGNLAPRIFWFRVTGPTPYGNNSMGNFVLSEQLPNSSEVPLVVTVVLN